MRIESKEVRKLLKLFGFKKTEFDSITYIHYSGYKTQPVPDITVEQIIKQIEDCNQEIGKRLLKNKIKQILGV